MLRVDGENHPGARVLGDMRCLPFVRSSFDAIWSCASLLHLRRSDLPAALNSFRMTLEDGGILIYLCQAWGRRGDAQPAVRAAAIFYLLARRAFRQAVDRGRFSNRNNGTVQRPQTSLASSDSQEGRLT
jgi:SAM-dependent methyltransferase